jgi:DNA-directed RNA polymerase subunit RPC12/RpoP
MLAFTCDKCGRRFTLPIEELQGYLAQSQEQKHAVVACPHCGRHNKVAIQRLHQALRFVRSRPTPAAEQPPVQAAEQPPVQAAEPAEPTTPETGEGGA